MYSGVIPVRYAKALLQFAMENKEEEKVYAETSTLAKTFMNVANLENVLLNPIIPNAQKHKIIIEAACGNNDTSASFSKFIDLLLRHGRVESITLIAHTYGRLYREAKKVIQGKLIVPAKVPVCLVDKCRSVIEKRTECNVDFEVVEDPAIGGGFILEYDNYSLDASLKSEIDKLKRALVY